MGWGRCCWVPSPSWSRGWWQDPLLALSAEEVSSHPLFFLLFLIFGAFFNFYVGIFHPVRLQLMNCSGRTVP